MFSSNTTQVSDGGYQISRSLRFNSADSAYLNRTPASAGNRRTWTFSTWLKRSKSGDFRTIFSAATDTSNLTIIRFKDDDKIEVRSATSGSTVFQLATTQVFRDYSAWYHFVLAVDTTNATGGDRVRLYVNGSEVTVFDTDTIPTPNADSWVNNNILHEIARQANNPSNYYQDGYMTEMYLIDGTQLTPSSFGETNAQTGVWQPKAYSGSYGTNGFYLNFSDKSNTTAATLGKDYSGNSNNWTPNNFSVTAGAGNDSLVDSPTSYGTDTGVGGTVRGNYCTLNPLSPPASGSPSYANGNLDGGVATYQSLVSTFSMTSSKWYWEVTPTGNSGSAGYFVAVSDANFPMSTRTWQGANFWGYFSNGSKYTNGGSASYGASFTTNDVIGVALDMDAGTVTFYKNGTSQGVAYSSLTNKSMQATVGDGTSTSIQYFSCNFGQRPFAYTAPSGFKALCTQNLPTPTIGATSTTLANKYFNPVLWTGTGTSSARSITGVGFQPDFVWSKPRSTAYQHNLYDVIRGSGKRLISNSTDAEATNATYGYLSSFDSDGFSTSAGATNNENWNETNATYVAWNWKANGAGSTNTAGSITSTVSANTTSGFSVATYTGNGSAGATIGHGLGVAPRMIIIKSRSDVTGWAVYQADVGNTKYLRLDGTDAANTASTLWNNTSPTSSVFSVGTDGWVNTSVRTYVAYCFAEVAGYSKFGSYTGNGSSDGPFIYTGFRPAYVMVKVTTAANVWLILDATRNTSNVVTLNLNADQSSAENTYSGWCDFTSNGFKVRGTDGAINTGSGTYIYMAVASNPFKYSLAR